MSVSNLNKKIVIKGDLEPTPHTFRYSEREVNCTLPLWQLNIVEAINELLNEEKGCSIWFSYMKD